MRKSLHHIFIQFLIVTLAGLGGLQAGSSLCAADCDLYEAPAVVSCCDDMSSANHGDMVSVKPVPEPSAADCSHGELCSVMNYPVEAGISSLNLFDDVGLPTASPAVYENSFVARLYSPPASASAPDSAFLALYTRNCSYLI